MTKTKKPVHKHVKSLSELLRKARRGAGVGFFITLGPGGCMRSSKWLSYHKKKYCLTNFIDDTWEELTIKQLINPDLTNIGEALEKNALYYD